MRRLCPSILASTYRGVITLLTQWRDLHSQSWGWGHDEQPRVVDEPVATMVEAHAAAFTSGA